MPRHNREARIPTPGPIIGTANSDTIGTNQPYSLRKAALSETIYGGDGNDTIHGLGGNDVLYGDKGNLVLPDNSTVGDNNDTLFGGDGQDTIFGEQGNDQLYGGNGADTISGGNGNDTILGEADADTLRGDDGADRISGGAGNDSLNGGAGADTAIYTGAWIDYTITDLGGTTTLIDKRSGSPDGTDTVTDVEIFQFANGTFTRAEIVNDAPAAVADFATAIEAGGLNNGTPGVDPIGNVLTNDTDPDSGLGDTKTVQEVAAGASAGPLGNGVGVAVVGIYGRLVLQANGAYAYTVDNGNPTVEALNSGDQLTDVFTYTMKDAAGQTSTTTLTVTIGGATDTPGETTIVGDDGANQLYGTAGDDTILGLGGDDQLVGYAGDDTIAGGGGNDIIYGEDPVVPVGARDAFIPFDSFTGGADEISGGDGDDIIYGDQISASASGYYSGAISGGADVIGGGDGDDVIYGDQVEASADGSLWGGLVQGGSDDISGGDGNDIIYGDQVSAIASGAYYGAIEGGHDTIAGDSGDDVIYGDGESGNSSGSITGGNDVIIGGPGNDLIYGDWAVAGDIGGHDTFVSLSTGDGRDTIADFGALGEDLIDVSAIDANTALSGDQAFRFSGTTAANYSIWFSDNGTNTTLYFDNNGNATADMTIVLLGVNGTDITLADFVA